MSHSSALNSRDGSRNSGLALLETLLALAFLMFSINAFIRLERMTSHRTSENLRVLHDTAALFETSASELSNAQCDSSTITICKTANHYPHTFIP